MDELFSAKSGKITFQIKGNQSVTCKSSEVAKGGGELTGPKKGLFMAQLSTCTASGLPINSSGDSSGVILLHVELERVCYINKESKDVGALLKVLPLKLEIPATKLTLEITGSFIALIQPINAEATEFKLGVAQAGGVQGIEKCEGEAADTLTTATDGGAATQTGVEAKELALVFDTTQELAA
jgi:hypothetical protein